MSTFLDSQVDPAIVGRARKGDMKAHEVLYRTYSVPVYTLARRMLQQDAMADEILQETFVEVLSKISAFKGEAPVGAWIRRIAVNKCLMQLRSAWHQRGEFLDDRPGGPDALAAERGAWSDSERLGSQMDLEQALARLHPRSRAVVWLYDVEGYTHAEIAQLMGQTVSFSKSQLSRAHERLQQLLQQENGPEPCMQVSNSY